MSEMSQMNVRIEKALHTEVKMFCLQRGITLEDLVRVAIEEYMEGAEEELDNDDNDLIDQLKNVRKQNERITIYE